MRLIGIGLLAFLLAGVALLLARSEMVGQSWRAARTLMDGPQLRFETPMAAEARAGADQAIIYRAGPAAPLILSGLPAYQGAVFHMPIDARPTSGYLQIDATSQVLDGVEGVLRISIDNTRRAEVLLRPGEAVRAVRIELTSADLARAQLVVSFSLQGTGANPVCTNDHSVDAVVEIETTSALYLSLDGPLESPRDRMASWGNQLRLDWTGGTNGLLQAVAAQRAGAAPMLVPAGGLTPEEAETALQNIRANRAPEPMQDFAWSEAMEETGNLFGLRRFQRDYTWRIQFDMDHAQRTNLAESLELSMLLPAHPMGADWQITVTHNGSIAGHYTGTAAQTRLAARIAIPAGTGSAHTIEITMTSAFLPEGQCNDGPEILAEILPETRIIPSDVHASDPVRSITQALSNLGSVGVSASGTLNASEANVAVALLAASLPRQPIMSADSPVPIVDVLHRGALVPDYAEAGVWLVFHNEEGNVVAEPAGLHAGRETRAVALLIQLPEAAT